jgi:hypothetical protein
MKSTVHMKKIAVRRTGDIRLTAAMCVNTPYVIPA